MKKILIVEINEDDLRHEWGDLPLDDLIKREMSCSTGVCLEEINDVDDNILHPGQQL